MKSLVRSFALVLAAMSLAGCVSLLAPRSDPTKFYVLSTTESSGATMPANLAHLVIGLGPINFPQYLARTDIVTRTTSNQIELSSRDRWAEPLDTTFTRVLSLDLSRALGDAQIVVFPSFGANYAFNYRVQLTIDRFETDESGTARLAARWEIVPGRAGRHIYASSSDIRESSTPGDTAAAAAALSRATAAFAGQLAQALSTLNASQSR